MDKNEEKLKQVDQICGRVCVTAVLIGAMLIGILLLAIIFIAPFVV